MSNQRDKDNLVRIIQKHGGEWNEAPVPAMTGNRSGIVDAGNGKVWVRIGSIERKVLSNGIPLAFDWHITIGTLRSDKTKTWRVRDIRYTYNETAESFVQAHAIQHMLGGFDQIGLDRKLVLSFTLFVADSTNFLVRAFGGLFPAPGGWVKGVSTDGDTIPDVDLSTYIPAAGAQYISVEYDETGAVFINDSGPVKESKELLDTSTDVASVAAGHRLIGFVMMYESMPELLNKHIYLPALSMTDYAAVETGYQIDHSPAGVPTNPDKFGFWSFSDSALEYITYEDLLALLAPVFAPTTRWEPLSNGDPVTPELVFDGDGDVIMIEVPI